MMRVLFGALLVFVPMAAAQEPAGTPDSTIRLTLQPAAEPVPALRYALLPEVREQIPGNAADHYMLAIIHLGPHPDAATSDRFHTWATTATKKLPRTEVRDALRTYDKVFSELALAARCDHCDWGLTERIRRDGIATLIPEIQHVRGLALLLRLRARLDIAEHHFDDAAGSIRIGLTMARHTGESPTLISALVGMAVTTMMAEEIEAWETEPGAPNLYWALTALPQPLISLRKPMQGERLFLDNLLPGLREAGRTTLSARQLQECENRLVNLLAPEGKLSSGYSSDWQRRLVYAAVVAKLYPTARSRLLAQGATAAELDDMRMAQVVLLDTMKEYERAFDDMHKWTNVPYWQAREGLRRLETKLREERPPGFSSQTLPALLLPAISKVHFAAARTQRRFAGIRVVEALRLYAAAHGGKLPDKLDAITDVLVPIDPVTGKGFEYTPTDDKAILFGPAPAGEAQAPSNTLRYELRLVNEKK